jgi:rhomboid protease GluP
MICTRIDGVEVWLEPWEWREWVREGRIGPTDPVLLESGVWVQAGTMDEYRDLASASLIEKTPEIKFASPVGVAFPKRGVSATEIILLTNILVAAALVILWGDHYNLELRSTVRSWWSHVRYGGEFWWMVPTLFMHASPSHLFHNLIALLAGSTALEYLSGRVSTVVMYIITGAAGAVFSYQGRDAAPLSVGASGAAFGLVGAVLAVLIRHRSKFPSRQQWKTRRVYFPLFVIFVGQSLLNADWRAHSGGFVAGIIFGFLLPYKDRSTQIDPK